MRKRKMNPDGSYAMSKVRFNSWPKGGGAAPGLGTFHSGRLPRTGRPVEIKVAPPCREIRVINGRRVLPNLTDITLPARAR